MLAKITWREFLEWVTFFELEPFDQEREDLRAASICAAVANSVRNHKKRPKAFVPADFVLSFGDHKRPKQTWQEQKQIGQMMAAMFNRRAKGA